MGNDWVPDARPPEGDCVESIPRHGVSRRRGLGAPSSRVGQRTETRPGGPFGVSCRGRSKVHTGEAFHDRVGLRSHFGVFSSRRGFSVHPQNTDLNPLQTKVLISLEVREGPGGPRGVGLRSGPDLRDTRSPNPSSLLEGQRFLRFLVPLPLS